MSEIQSLPYLITKQGLTISLPNGEVKTVLRDNGEQTFNDVVAAIREKRWDDVVELVNPKELIKTYSDGRFEVVNGVVHIDGEAVPDELSANILEFRENELPYEPLIEFWKNLRNNPSYRAVKQLFTFLQANKHPITEDGHFLAYKKVRDDFKDFYTGTMDNSPGTVVEMPRNKVNEDPEQTCSSGIHCASFQYANVHYNGGVGQLLMVKVNPADVVAVPVDYNAQKMRVCRYEVVKVVEVELPKTPLYREERPTDVDDLNTKENDDYPLEEEDDDEDCEGECSGCCCGCECEEDEVLSCGYCGDVITENEDYDNDGLCHDCWEFKYG